MKGCIFSLGKVDRKNIWPFLFAIIQIAIHFINKIFPREKVNQVIDSQSISLGKMLVIIIPFLYKGKEKIIKRDEICTKNNIKYHAILWIISLLSSAAITIATLKDSNIVITIHGSLLISQEAAQIIIIIFITMIFFKSKYYIHHIICLVIFCGLCVGIDFLIDNFKKEAWNQAPLAIIFNIIVIIVEIIQLCYMKYMMNTLYYHYWTISFSHGLIILLLSTLTIIGAYIFGNKDDKNNYYYSYFQFLENAEFKYSFSRFISWMILYGLLQLFQSLSLENLSVNHMMISYELGKIAKILDGSKSDKKWYSIILFILQFIILLFFLEIFEFNFCNLNKNTKRNIEERSLTTMDMRESINSVNKIDINGYSFIQEKPEDNKEMDLINNDKEDENVLN